jgi:hypothetical protein
MIVGGRVMARRRYGMGGFWLQLTLQTALLVTAANAEISTFTPPQPALLSAPADDAFVYLAPIEPAHQTVAFEDFAMDFYLPPEPAPAYETYIDSSALPPDDYALLGGPEYNYHSDDFILGY